MFSKVLSMFVSFWKQLTLSRPSYGPIDTARPSALLDKIISG
jgi:hypothetical protein